MELPVKYRELTPAQKRKVRREYVERQDGLCMFCGESLDGSPSDEMLTYSIKTHLFPYNFFKYPTHLQHNRKTGYTEGACHAHCNAVAWQYWGR